MQCLVSRIPTARWQSLLYTENIPNYDLKDLTSKSLKPVLVLAQAVAKTPLGSKTNDILS